MCINLLKSWLDKFVPLVWCGVVWCGCLLLGESSLDVEERCDW